MSWSFLDTCKCVLHEASGTLIIHCPGHLTFAAAVADNKAQKFDDSPRSTAEEAKFKIFMKKINDVKENQKLKDSYKNL